MSYPRKPADTLRMPSCVSTPIHVWTAACAFLVCCYLGQPAQAQNPSASAPLQAATDVVDSAAVKAPMKAPHPPNVQCGQGKLTVAADDATMGAILDLVKRCAGLEIDVPEALAEERTFTHLGPGPMREVLDELLSSSEYDYIIEAGADPEKIIRSVTIVPRDQETVRRLEAGTDGTLTMTPARRLWMQQRQQSEVHGALATHTGAAPASQSGDRGDGAQSEPDSQAQSGVKADSSAGNETTAAANDSQQDAAKIAKLSDGDASKQDSVQSRIQQMEQLFAERKALGKKNNSVQAPGTTQ